MKDAKGKIVGASKVARDITERVRQKDAIQAANAALVRANSDLQEFADSASHDLQEPLRSVTLYSQLVQRQFGEQLGPVGESYVARTIEGAARMRKLLLDLRNYAEAARVTTDSEQDVDGREVLDKALANLDIAIRESGATISAAKLPRVRMHEFRLAQIFQNLIGNAIHHRSERSPVVEVAVERRGHHWLFSVKDNGVGIDPQYKEQIFGIFKRLQSASNYSGTGMGLAICQRIVERAGGRFGSNPSKERVRRFSLRSRSEAASEPSSLILLIEDNLTDVEFIRMALEEHGVVADVVHIADGGTALHYFEHLTSDVCPDLAIVDINMPNRSGLEVLRGMREHECCSNIPIVILSSSDGEQDRASAASFHATEYLCKPPDLDAFWR